MNEQGEVQEGKRATRRDNYKSMGCICFPARTPNSELMHPVCVIYETHCRKCNFGVVI